MTTETPPPCWKCDQIGMIMKAEHDSLYPEERIAWLWDIHGREHIEEPAES